MLTNKCYRPLYLRTLRASLLLALLLAGCGQMRLSVADPGDGVTRLAAATATALPAIPEMTPTPAPPLAGATAIVPNTVTPTRTPYRPTTGSATVTGTATAPRPSPSPSATSILSPPTSTPARPQVPTAPPGPRIASFQAHPASVSPGDSVTLSWETAADRVELCLQVPFQGSLVTRECEQVPGTSVQEYALDPVYRSGVVLSLRASRNGATVEEAAHVSVVCAANWWFFADPPESCPVEEPQPQQAAVQHFQRGTMIWLSESGVYYILTNQPGQTYQVVYDPLQRTGSVGVAPGEPPPGLQEPVSGFGLLWRGEIAGLEEGLYDRLGWALGAEFNYEAAIQHEAVDRYARTFLRGPDGQTLVLFPPSYSWSIWTGP